MTTERRKLPELLKPNLSANEKTKIKPKIKAFQVYPDLVVFEEYSKELG